MSSTITDKFVRGNQKNVLVASDQIAREDYKIRKKQAEEISQLRHDVTQLQNTLNDLIMSLQQTISKNK